MKVSDKIYQEELMDHYKFPRNRQKIKDPDFFADDGNITCGDKIHIEGKIENNKITEIGFDGSGCVISQAAASMLTEKVLGKTIDEVLALNKDDIIELLGIELGPNRLKCALLSLQVLKKGLSEFKE
ncbi:MAG: Fe-S cluster assembly sulfur transfer protein SufU [bacterium]